MMEGVEVYLVWSVSGALGNKVLDMATGDKAQAVITMSNISPQRGAYIEVWIGGILRAKFVRQFDGSIEFICL